MSHSQLRAVTKVAKRILTQRRFLIFEAGFMSGETQNEQTEVRAPTVDDNTERGL